MGQNILEERAELHRSGLEIFLQFPVFGGGVESFGFYNDLILRGAGYQRIYSSTHNFLLQLGGGMGLTGILTIAFCRSVPFAMQRKRWIGRNRANRWPPSFIFQGLRPFCFMVASRHSAEFLVYGLRTSDLATAGSKRKSCRSGRARA
ncbi:MAG: hypothetical protein KDK33_12605 [Leptospiraceae bacterium]|nr:hypothetical protein [Leptospiraceae bacterium]